MRGMTQNYLDTLVGFPDRSGDVRLVQYETGSRKPKADLTAALAHALDVSPHCQTYQADRLIALGLLNSAIKSMSIGSVSGSQTQRYIQTNDLGKLFCEIALQ